jgi:nucleotidyltransferase/DNA polymerase involved in DNA repair
MERQIVCFGIPRFAVALARLDDPTLRTRPVAVAFAHTSRAIIHEASPEAEEAGVIPGLQADQARRRCPSLKLVPPNPPRVAQAHHTLMRFMTPIAPVWESFRPGHFYLDLTGTARLFGATCDTTMRCLGCKPSPGSGPISLSRKWPALSSRHLNYVMSAQAPNRISYRLYLSQHFLVYETLEGPHSIHAWPI